MNLSEHSRQETLIVGHKNPDTDSICSAIAYAALKNQTEEGNFVPCRAGEVSAETRWVLNHFGLEEPRLLEDVAPIAADAEIRRIRGVSGELSVKEAWAIMRDNDISTLPVVDSDGRLTGVVSFRDLAAAQMESLDKPALSQSRTRYRCIAKTLCGTVLCGDGSRTMEQGRVFVGAGDPEAIRMTVHPGDLMLVSNRASAQRTAIESGAGCLVVCLNAPVSAELLALARERDCVLISTPFDTFKAAYFVNQSVPVRHCMTTEGIRCFRLSTPLEDVVQVMGKTRFTYFPILDENGRYYGVLSRRNVLNRSRKQLILVDHNEKSQCVAGWEQADIREVIDHHRVGGISTLSPILFRNQPVGSTATIVYQMFRERGAQISRPIAGALCCAILSDTLLFRSPTCTALDEQSARELAIMVWEEPEALAEAMFEAGEDLAGKTGAEVLRQDYKVFTSGTYRIGIAQSAFFSTAARKKAADMTAEEIPDILKEDRLDFVYYLLTDVQSETSYVRFAGERAEELLELAFPRLQKEQELSLPGVISRKKQFVPAIMAEIQNLDAR